VVGVFDLALSGAVAGHGADYFVVDSSLVAGGGDAGAPPRSVFFEAGLDALLVAFDEAEVVLGLVFFTAEGLGEVDEVEHCGLNSLQVRKSAERVSPGATSM